MIVTEILFVCTGNTCRSAMAEAIARDVFCDKADALRFVSRGINVMMPSRATPDAIRAVQSEYSIDMNNHLARALSEADLRHADLVLAMTGEHKHYLLYVYPAFADKIFTLSEYTGTPGGNVNDPYGMDASTYKNCAKELRGYIEKLATALEA